MEERARGVDLRVQMIAEVKELFALALAVKLITSGAAASLGDDGIAAQAEEAGDAQGSCRGARLTCKLPLGSKEAQDTVVDSPREGERGRKIEKGVDIVGQETRMG